METAMLAYASEIRIICFALVFLCVVFWETLAPRRPVVEKRFRHDIRNLSVNVLSTVVAWILMPVLPVGFAVIAAERGWGILHHVSIPEWTGVLLTVIILDLAVYLQHVLFHAVPILWRLHFVHHTDLDYSSSTGIRFHPFEIVLSLAIKLGLIFILGPPAVGVLIFEILLNGTALFNHGNVRLPVSIDRCLRWILVTPDMHRVHHSVEMRETNSNYGFNLTWWDRSLGTYIRQPEKGHEQMSIGLKGYRAIDRLTFIKLLALPFLPRRSKT
jgi:sterol desaturase/sphingolipid hydroxylase (fatty acid hydroxylase superfamily)